MEKRFSFALYDAFIDDENLAKKNKVKIWSDASVKKILLQEQKEEILQQEEESLQEQIEQIVLLEKQAVLADE